MHGVIDWATWLAYPKGVNESHDKQRTVHTIMPAFVLSGERKESGNGSIGGA